MDQDTKLIMFLDSLGEDADVDFARQMLEAHNWDLETALLAVTGGEGAGATGVAAAAQPPVSPTHDPHYVDADGYRAPMRTGYRDTLIGPSPEELMFEQAAAQAMAGGWNEAAAVHGHEAAGGHGGSHDEIRRAMRASQSEYQRRADHQEQGMLAEAIQASQANYMQEEQRRTAEFIQADHEEQQLIARAIEASFREQNSADAHYRDMLDRATEASKGGGAAPAYPTAAYSSTGAQVARPSRGAAAAALSRPGIGERPSSGSSGTIRTAGSPSTVGHTSPTGTVRRASQPEQRLLQPSSSMGLHSPSYSNGTDSRDDRVAKDLGGQPRHAQQTRSTISAIPPSGLRSRTSRTETGASAAAPFRNVRNGSAKLHDEVVGGIASRPSAVSQSTGMRGAPSRMPVQPMAGTSSGSTGLRSGSQPQKPARPPPTQPPPPTSSSGSYRSPMGTPPAVRTPPGESELFPKVAAGSRGSGLRPLPQTAAVLRTRTPPGAARVRTPPGAAPGQEAAAREAAEAERRRQEEERTRVARAAAREEEAAREAERRRRAEEEARLERQRQQQRELLQQQREQERREAAEADERRRRAEAEQRRRDEIEAAEAERRRREKDAEAARLQREKELRQREIEAAEAKAAAAEEEVRRQEAEAEARRRAAREEEDLRREREEAEARRREAEGVAQSEEKEGNELVSALVGLRRRYKEDPQGLATCLQTLRTYINNLARNPHEVKFQRINCENAAFKNRVAAYEGATTVLGACGFEKDGTSLVVGEAYLKSKGPALFDAVAKLDVLIDQLKR